jgi:hypothetical protein
MPPQERLQIAARDAVHRYLAELPLRDSLAITLTLRQGDSLGQLDEVGASKNLRHFLNRLNSAVFGKRFKRFGRRLNVVPVLERSLAGRLHYHLILENPFPENPLRSEVLIEQEWIQTRFGYREIHIDHHIDEGWVSYITKSKTASDGVDWENFHWN